MEYYSAIKKNTFESVLMRWMKLEPLIQSEVSQKEKYQYNIYSQQVPLSMGFSRQKYWSGLPLPSPPIQYTNTYIWNLERW